MTPSKRTGIRRRTLIGALLALPAIAIVFRVIRPTADKQLVEVDGWILQRSDLEGDQA